MRDPSASLRVLFASVIAAVGTGPLGCHRDAPATVAPDPVLDAATSATTESETTPPRPGSRGMFHCPPPYPVVLDGGLPASAGFDGSVPSVLPADVCRDPAVCGAGSAPRCTLVDAGPPVTVECSRMCIGGRRPEGFDARAEDADGDGDEVAAWLASLARLEAASVPAFRRVARELSRHGAPRRLVGACERAARDEVRHARAARRLARDRGGRNGPFVSARPRPRSLEELAIENAVEGCVRETYGALVATWQARCAQDPRIRVHFARIARDETGHAALAWRIDAWARARLDRAARARVDAARRAARDDLRAALAGPPSPGLARAVGLPSAGDAVRLASALDAVLA